MATAVEHRTARNGSFFVGYAGKRLLDGIIAASALILLSPVLALVAILVKLTSPGPVFFRQRRLGLREVPFSIFKFRSMRVNAESTGPKFTVAGDPRITWIGRIIRKTSVDELPQLLNVIWGDMSLIGPRPYVGFELEEWTPEQRAERAEVRPGISGMAQAFGRSGLSPEESRQLDIQYVRRCSLWLDAGLVFRTIRVVLFSRGTN